MYNLVGFQTKLTWPEQQRIFRMVRVLRRPNSSASAPCTVTPSLTRRRCCCPPSSCAATSVSSLLARSPVWKGMLSPRERIPGRPERSPPGRGEERPCLTGYRIGALVRHITTTGSRHFQPMNVNYGLFPDLPDG